MSEERQGWWWPLNCRKAHYIIGARSLCRKWGCFGPNPDLQDHSHDSTDNCVVCKRRVKDRIKRGTMKV